MKTITYRCDFCNDDFAPNRSGIATKFVAIKHTVTSVNGGLYQRFDQVPPEEARWHVCHDCLAALVELARTSLPSPEFNEAIQCSNIS